VPAEVNQPTQVSTSSADLILDESGLILDIRATGDNARLAAGVSEGEGIGEYIHPDDREFFALCRHWALNSSGAPQTTRLRWARSNGHYSSIYATFVAESSETVRVRLMRDEAEQSKRTVAQLTRVAEGSLQGIVVRTSKELLFMNDAFARLTGYESARQLMSELRDLGPNGGIHAEDLPMIAERVRRRLAGEETISHYQFRMMHRDGGVRWVDTLATLIEWDGQPASLSWMTDITERKAMEAEILKSKEEAEFANRSKTEFLAHMSHELRTPLNAIIGFAEVIKTEMFGPVGLPKYIDYAGDIHKSGEHLLDLINDILDLSKLEAGKLELNESEVTIPDIVCQCCSLVRNKAELDNIKLVTEIDAQVPRLRADQRALKQVLLNFLSNAVKFTPYGGTVTVRVRAEVDGAVSISVSDTGIGMKPEHIEIALKPFGQIDSKMARQHKGSGLGLPICKSLVELHGGALVLESEPDKGTTVIATFPAERTIRAAA
jgi:two-component system cell cycle sensor histidine kinase PleC